VFIVLGVLHALSPRFRHTVPRYFTAHGFYLEAVRGGRDILLGTNTVLLLVMSAGAGIIGAIIFASLHDLEAFRVLLSWLLDAASEPVIAILERPLAMVLLVGSIYALGVVLWAACLILLSGKRRRMVIGQALMLILWPNWTMLLLMLAALASLTLPPQDRIQAAFYLIPAWVGLNVLSVGRTLYDFYGITLPPWYRLIMAVLLNPLTIFVVLCVLLILSAYDETLFLWHLARYGR
jgi:hypothetical protein